MAMNVGSSGGEDEVMMDINTTPLIDVMLVLLIMLIITIPVQTHAVKLDFPPPQPPKDNQVLPQVVDILIDFDGSIYGNEQRSASETKNRSEPGPGRRGRYHADSQAS